MADRHTVEQLEQLLLWKHDDTIDHLRNREGSDMPLQLVFRATDNVLQATFDNPYASTAEILEEALSGIPIENRALEVAQSNEHVGVVFLDAMNIARGMMGVGV